jgi:hypothetical protein
MPPKKHPLASADSSTNEGSSKKPKLVAVHTNKKYCSSILNKKKNKNVINYWESSSNSDSETKLFCALFCKGNVHGNAFLNPLPQMILDFLHESAVVNMVVVLKDFPDHSDEALVSSDNAQFSGPILGFIGTPKPSVRNAHDFAATLNHEAVHFINNTHVNAYPVREFVLEELKYANGLPLSKIFHDEKDLWQALDMLFDCDSSADNWAMVYEDSDTHHMIYGEDISEQQAKHNLSQLHNNYATSHVSEE